MSNEKQQSEGNLEEPEEPLLWKTLLKTFKYSQFLESQGFKCQQTTVALKKGKLK